MTLATFIQASAHKLDGIAAGCVQAIVTSPPYYGLRKYSGEQDVEWPAVEYAPMPGLPLLAVPAMRSPLGNEPTLEAYIGHLVLCLRRWREVLRDDGVCFVNLGDSFSGSGGAGGDYNDGGLRAGQPKFKAGKSNGLKPKDLMMVPARFALAAQADGWWLRSDIIGHKIAPMPESVTDRPTRSHEHIFMLTKAARYFWDAEGVKEEGKDWGGRKREIGEYFTNGVMPNGAAHHGLRDGNFSEKGRNMRDVIEWRPSPFPGAHFAVWPEAIPEKLIRAATSERGACPHCGAPWRRVVEKSRATFARTDDPTLATGRAGMNRDRPGQSDRYVLAISQPELAQILRNAANGRADEMRQEFGSKWDHWTRTDNSGARVPTFADAEQIEQLLGVHIPFDGEAVGFAPSCTCPPHESVPCIVLDPFSGSGTTAKVAVRLGRRAIGVDVSAEYLDEVTALRFGDGVQMELTGL